MKVVKFGGTSLASGVQIKKVLDIIKMDSDRKIIIVSAPGKRYKDDIKVTDLLIKLGEECLSSIPYENTISKIIERYNEIAIDLCLGDKIINEIKDDLKNRIARVSDNKKKFMDLIKASGEDNNAKLVAEFFKNEGLNAKYINPKDAGLILTNDYGDGRVLEVSYDNLKKMKEMDEIIVFPGFFGSSPSGEVVTFSRGGSDISGAILSAAVDADIYENFTDVDFVFSANPNIVQNPKPINDITYREMRELSYAGFSVLHEETVEPLFKKGIPINIKNTNNVEARGTIININRDLCDNPVVGIACQKGFCSIFIEKFMMNREIGFGRKVLQILEEEAISYEHIPSGIDNISVILKEEYLTNGKEQRILNRINNELNPDQVYTEKNLAMIMVVGEGMRKTIGVAAKTTRAFECVNINIEMINQGSSEVSMIFGVKDKDADKAVKVLYEHFFDSK